MARIALLRVRWTTALAIAAVATSACATGAARTAPPSDGRARSDSAAIAKARADSARYPYTAADVRFMSDMIGHHAQAIVMARWAPTHGAGPSVVRLAQRVINAQQDEIASMQQWLRDRRQPVPEVRADGTTMMHGAGHHVHMPGMLTEQQLQQLDRARGKEFDRLFLTFMIQHHQGAVSMVKELFGSYGAGLDETVFKLASDINVDQITEIDRMQTMLAEIVLGIQSP